MLEFEILGPLLVRDESGEIDISGARRRALLIRLLVSANNAVTADRLIEDVWDGDPPAGANQTLQSHLSFLRKKLGPDRIRHSAPGYVLVCSDDELDVRQFEIQHQLGIEAYSEGDFVRAASTLEAALSRWRGDPLSDVNTAAWATSHLARFGEMRANALETWIDSLLKLGRHTEVVTHAEAATADYPFSERLWAQLMLSLYRSGRQADALRTFQRLRGRLDEELGIEPSAELVTLDEAVVMQKPELDWVDQRPSPPSRSTTLGPPTNLTEPVSSFLGRGEELRVVEGLLREGRLVTLTGPGGVGKTRLATEVGRVSLTGSSDRATGDGVWLVELANLTERGDVPSAVAQALGIGEQVGEDTVAALCRVLAVQSRLIIVDNCEHVLQGCAELADVILRTCPGVVFLATSREPLRIDGEAIFPVPSLTLPPEYAVSRRDLDSSGAALLFIERAKAHSPDFDPKDEDVPLLTSICRSLDGIPLALELATPRLRSMSLAQLNQRLTERFTLLTKGNRVALPRQQTLRALVDWSHDLLSHQEQVLFRRTTIFVDGFDLEAAEAVCGLDDISESDIADLLASLVDKSLVVADQAQGAIRFRLLETLREYGRERLDQAGGGDRSPSESRRLADAHGAYYLSFGNDAAPRLVGSDSRRVVSRLNAEESNLLLAIEHALASPTGADRVLDQFWSLSQFWKDARQPERLITLIDRALELVGPGATPARRGRALCCKAALLTWVDRRLELEALLEALQLARTCGDQDLEVHALSRCCKAYVDSGRGNEGRDAGARGVVLARQIGDPVLLGRALFHYAMALDETGAQECEDTFLQAIAELENSGDELTAVSAHNSFACFLIDRGRLADARVHLEKAVDLTGDDKTAQTLAVYLNFGWVLVEEDESSRAAPYFIDVLRRSTLTGLLVYVPYAVLGLACCATHDREVERAAVLHGGADALMAADSSRWELLEQGIQSRDIAILKDSLREDFERHYAVGAALSAPDLVRAALASHSSLG